MALAVTVRAQLPPDGAAQLQKVDRWLPAPRRMAELSSAPGQQERNLTRQATALQETHVASACRV